MSDEPETRHVVRLGRGHEALQVVRANEAAAAAGDMFHCQECGRSQSIVEIFEVEP